MTANTIQTTLYIAHGVRRKCILKGKKYLNEYDAAKVRAYDYEQKKKQEAGIKSRGCYQDPYEQKCTCHMYGE